MVEIRKQRGLPHFLGITKLAVIGMIIAFGAASVNTVWALYLDSFLHSAVYVGIFSSILTISAFIFYFLFIPIIEKHDKAKLFALSLALAAFLYIALSINKSLPILFLLAIFMAAILTLRVTSFGILVKNISSQKKLSRNEGLVYTFANIAFVIGPLLAAFIIANFGISKVFLMASGFYILGFTIFAFSKIKGNEGKKRIDRNIKKNFVSFFKSKERSIAYILGSGVSMWWTLIYLFMPLYLIRNDFSGTSIGIFLFAIALPLVSFQYFFSKLAGKIGFKKIFKTGYLWMAVAALLCFILTNNYLILSILILASVGMAMLESTTEAYFFDVLKGKERYRFYGPYGTAIDFGNLTGKVLGTLLLILLPFKFIFLLFSVLMFTLFLISFKTKNIIEKNRK